jgi:hypothetical protein
MAIVAADGVDDVGFIDGPALWSQRPCGAAVYSHPNPSAFQKVRSITPLLRYSIS